MRFAEIMAMAAVAAAGAQGMVDMPLSVNVYVAQATTPCSVTMQAQSLASRMFMEIGVKVKWQAGGPPVNEQGSIAIELADQIPPDFRPGALAFALPFEGVHIRIFWDRIRLFQSPAKILAHVMVHEITHVLQGLERHSEEGIMKARWTDHDQFLMRSKPLRFTPGDVALIHHGMEARALGRRSASGSEPGRMERAGLR